MFKLLDNWIDKTTMYRVVLYEVIALLVCALFAALFHAVPYAPLAIIFSTAFILLVCWLSNAVSAWIFKVPKNVESIYITALILTLIISPPTSPHDMAYFSLAVWASIWAAASKYIFTYRHKHFFNPAAFAVALTAFTINGAASWWVATPALLIPALLGGWLIVKKIRRYDLMAGFFIASFASLLGYALLRHLSPAPFLLKTLEATPIVFFATVMLTEPLTSPPTKWLRVAYGAIVGFLFSPWLHLGALYSTPELALVLGNVFSFAVSPKQKLILKLKSKVEEANQTTDFIFESDQPLAFKAGQYLEWTLEHPHPDARGNRRYFTIASAPTEKELHLGVKFQPNGSSFKKALAAMKPGDTIAAAQLAGDFTLPRYSDQKIAFIAGGIGVTPFRSMIKDLVDTNDERSVILLYANKTPADIAYKKVFDEAEKKMNIQTVYVATDPKAARPEWGGRIGALDERMIKQEIPDYLERQFYLSGPHGMVTAFDKTLRQMGLPASNIKKDFFPGFA